MADNIPIPPAHLPEKQRIFFVRYLQTLNAYQAAIDAGYAESTAKKAAYLWVGKNWEKCPKPYLGLWEAIQEATKQQIETVALTAKRVLEEWMAIAFFNLQDLFDPETGNPLPLNQLPPEAVSALESIQVLRESCETGNGKDGALEILKTAMVKFKGHNKIEALKFLSKYMRLDPTVEYKSGNRQGGGRSEKAVIKDILSQVAGKTRGLPEPVYEFNDDHGGEE